MINTFLYQKQKALQMKKMKVLSVNALKAGKAKTAKLVSLIDFGVSNCQ